MNEWAAPPPPRKPRRWLRRLAWIAGGLFLLLLLVYFVATSAPFLKVVILPKVGNALHAAITVEDASLHPFFSVSLSGLEVRTTGPAQLEVRNVSLTNATVRRLVTHTNGVREILELAGVNLTLDRLQNGQAGNLVLAADVACTREFPPTQTATNSALEGRIAGAFQFVLGAELQPHAIQGNSTLQVSKAAGSFADLAGVAAALDCELTAT